MNRVTCSLCSMKTDELKWKKRLVSANHLQLCKNTKDTHAKKFSETIFDARPEKSKIFVLRNVKTQDF